MADIIGIDPGKNCGIAILNPHGTITHIDCQDFWATFWFILSTYESRQAVIVCEQGGLNHPTFAKDYVANAAAAAKVSRNVGAANREAELMALGLESRGFHVATVRPTEKKWDAQICAQLTGYTKRTNEHSRDALRLAWNYYHQQRRLARIKK